VIRLGAVHRDGSVKATFTLPAGSDDQRVAVVGEFNGWDPEATIMRRRGQKQSASVTLEAGQRYAFRYRDASGAWFDDPTIDLRDDNGVGGTNCVIDLTDR
jgi:1,4-alpha-glucan branching enzyme